MVHQQEPLMVLQLGQQRQQVLRLWHLQPLVGGAQQTKQLLHLQARKHVEWWCGVSATQRM
jgi:hypothetical protein